MGPTLPITGGCFCGKYSFSASKAPEAVAYCHCNDCRRFSGAPVSVFGAFASEVVTFLPDNGTSVSRVEGAERSLCDVCGSPLGARYDYLPGQTYVAIGLLDHPEEFEPQVHAHLEGRLPWLPVNDSLDCFTGSSRDRLSQGGNS